FVPQVAAEGQVVDKSVQAITVNGRAPKMSLKGDFSATQQLEIGKNAVKVAGLDRDKKEIFSQKFRILRLKPFPDVAAEHWVRLPISLLAMQTIITGYPNGTFVPGGNITRAEMCTLLMKTKLLGDKLAGKAKGKDEDEGQATFGDVSVKHWAAPYVKMASDLGVVLGYPDGTFRPKNNITRAEGVAMIARFAGISQEAWANQFTDVPATHWAAEIIAGASNAGVLEYLKGKNFELKRLLTRAETVEMLYRTRYVREDVLAKDLLNWETY
ncbi:S-layer homology domain-containing protein, partial [Candidatus Margulisiibacteriota bacterium]